MGFDLVVCGGGLTWVEKAEHVMCEFCRVTRPGGFVVFTQRTDTFEKFGYGPVQEALVTEGAWSCVKASKPKPYLPYQEHFGDKTLVTYFVYQKAELNFAQEIR